MKKLALTAASAAILGVSSSAAFAETSSNSMTNIITLVDACDIIAIGIDFGVHPSSLTSDITGVVTANTDLADTSNTPDAHPHKDFDGTGADSANADTSGTSGDDVLSLSTGTALDTVINTAINAAGATDALPGVYVACTTAPSQLELSSANMAANVDLPVGAGDVGPTNVVSEMDGDGGGAVSGTDSVDYEIDFVSLIISDPAGLLPVYTGFHTATGSVIAGDQDGTHPKGYYFDIITAELTF